MRQDGYVTLIGVLVIGAIIISFVTGDLQKGVNFTRTTIQTEASLKARYYASGCAEEALEILRENDTFLGNGSVSYLDGSCNYEVSDTGGGTVQILTSSSSGGSYSKIKIVVSDFTPQIVVESWQHVADF